MCTECLVVFPEGISIIPWMVPGTNEIGKQQLKNERNSDWFYGRNMESTGQEKDMDEVFGLIETAEKAAEVYTYVKAQGPILQTITDENLWRLADAFGVTPKAGYLEEVHTKAGVRHGEKPLHESLPRENKKEYKKRHDELWPEMRTALRELSHRLFESILIRVPVYYLVT